jgi:hypothetical protein
MMESGAVGERTAAPPAWTRWGLGFGILALGLATVGSFRTIDLDVFHEMALIREALVLGGIPTEDTFSYTSSVSPVVHHEWGMGAVLYFLVVGLGLRANGLVLLRFVLLAGVVAGCVVVARGRGAAWREMALLAPLGILLFSPGLVPVRAHMFTFAFLAALLVLLERERAGDRRWLLLWPPLFVAWLNVHGGFVVGLGLLGLYLIERLWRAGMAAPPDAPGGRAGWRTAVRDTRHLFLAVAITPPLLLLNPYGLDYVPYLWHALRMDRPYMTEWLPLWSPSLRAPLAAFLVSALILAYAMLRGRAWKRGPGLLLLLATALFALQSARILPIYAVVWFSYGSAALSATPLARVLERLWQRHARPVAALSLVVGGVALLTILQRGSLTVFLPVEEGDHRRHLFPAGAVEYLREIDFEGNLMTPFGVGAYVSWKLHPKVKVGMDSRYEVAYAPELAEEVMRTYQGGGDWRALLARHPTDAVLVPGGGPLDALIRSAATDGAAQEEATWVEVFRDDAYAIFARPDVAAPMPRVDRTGQGITGSFP